jgi:NAD(P)-dependent dehydrogenase (short-subunit alcohol dehydrogenase family)
MYKSIKDKRVLITGASGGIGSCMALLFAEHGAIVGVHYNVGENESSALVNEIEQKGGKAAFFKADLIKESGKSVVQSFINHFGGLDILVNNAGAVFGTKDILDLDEESWDKTFYLNSRAPFFLAQSAFKHMKDQGGGKIINISSISVKYGGSSQTLHYGAAKSALETVTLGLSKAGAKHNILVNTVRGGFIDTPMHQKMGRKNLEKRIEMIPLKRAGKPQDVAGMVLFLASESGDFITGETFTVAGGD